MSSNESEKIPWYFKNSVMVIVLLSVGPLALPLIWFHPKMTSNKKILWTVVILVLTYFLVVTTIESFKKLSETYQELKTMM